jgi:hypothetical protein
MTARPPAPFTLLGASRCLHRSRYIGSRLPIADWRPRSTYATRGSAGLVLHSSAAVIIAVNASSRGKALHAPCVAASNVRVPLLRSPAECESLPRSHCGVFPSWGSRGATLALGMSNVRERSTVHIGDAVAAGQFLEAPGWWEALADGARPAHGLRSRLP